MKNLIGRKIFKRKYMEKEKITLPHRQPINQPSKRLLRLADKRLPIGTVAEQSWLLFVADMCWKQVLCFLCRQERGVENSRLILGRAQIHKF